MTVFKSRSFAYPKDPENPQQNQDAFQVSNARGLAVVADGVSSAIFSAAWAEILTRHVIDDLPNPEDSESFAQWLQALRAEWEQSIDTSNLSWFQRPKLAAGAFSTLVWVQVREIARPKEGSSLWNRLQNPDVNHRLFHVKGYCIGDSCMFHVRPGRSDSPTFPESDLYQAIPITDSRSFDLPPIVLGSKDLGRDAQMKFHSIDLLAQEGDFIILATDAVSQWLLKCYEEKAYPRWDLFWNLTPELWGQELDAMRASGEIRYDDSTLVLLQLGDSDSLRNEISHQVAETPVQDPETQISDESQSEVAEVLNVPLEKLEQENSTDFTPDSQFNSELQENNTSEEQISESEHDFPLSESESVFQVSEPEVIQTSEPEVTLQVPEPEPEFQSSEQKYVNQASEPQTNVRTSVPEPPKPALESYAKQTTGIHSQVERKVVVSHATTQPKEISKYVQTSAQPVVKAPVVAQSSAMQHATAQPARRPVVPSVTQPHSTVSSAHTVSSTHTVLQPVQSTEVSCSEEADSEKLVAGWKQIREGSAQIAGILGEQISDGMVKLGEGLNEGVSQFSEAAKPKIQSMAQRLTNFFHRRGTGEGTENSDTENEQQEQKPPARVIDPNRRRFYNPPPRE